MEVKSHTKLFFGMLFVAFGLIGIFNLWDFFSINLPWQVWPVGIIVVGVLFMIRQKGLAFSAALLFIVLGVFSSGLNCCEDLESRDFARSFDLDGVEYVDLNLEYGAGSVVLGSSGSDEIIFEATTSDFDDPRIDERVFEDDAEKVISISREGGFGFGDEESWRIFLSDDAVYDLNLEYGVSDVSLDFRGLDVSRLEIGAGVSDTRIVFGEYPTVVKIGAGVSDFDLEFPEGSGVVIDVDGGLLDKDFDGFVKKNGRYYSSGFVEGGKNIVVSFEGGVSDLGGEFY